MISTLIIFFFLGVIGDRLKEVIKINLFLFVLGNVIFVLVDGKFKYISYRDFKLIRFLQDLLGGNIKILMVVCLFFADNNYDEILSTFRYVNRVKNIQNKFKINEDSKDVLLRQYQEEIEKLKVMLMGQILLLEGGLGNIGQWLFFFTYFLKIVGFESKMKVY